MSDTLTLPARLLSCGWLNASTAWSDDPDLVGLYRTVLVEQHDHGVLLVATDSHILLTAWVADTIADPKPSPGWDVLPGDSWLVSDADERGVNLAKWLWKVTKPPKGDVSMPAELAQVSLEDPDQPTLAPEMEREALALRTDVERVSLPLVEVPFPEWRGLVAGHVEKATRRLIVSPDMMARLGRIVGVGYGAAKIELGLSGPLGPVAFTVASDAPVRGLFMPMRNPDDEQ